MRVGSGRKKRLAGTAQCYGLGDFLVYKVDGDGWRVPVGLAYSSYSY